MKPGYRLLMTAVLFACTMVLHDTAWAQKPIRVGTTAANFLEIGYGAAGAAMGDAPKWSKRQRTR